VLVEIFDFVPAQVERSNRLQAKSGNGRLETITWFLPEFSNAFYGGIHTILRFADMFGRNHNVRSQFCTLGHMPERRIRSQVAAAFPDLAAASTFFCVDAQSKVNELPATDAAICSLWTTAYAALEFEKTRRKFYFIQDDEALFYPAGSISALVEATYGFGFHGICNTVSLLKSYEDRGGEGECFSPCIDTSVFHHRNRANRFPHTLFCYGRPGHPRNSFELLSAALRLLKQRMGDRLLAISAGAEWDPSDYRLDGVVWNLGLLPYQSTGALYRMCDAGIAIMMTRHPSYLPMELMGCGSLVVTNRNPDTSWLLKDAENCLLSDLSPTSLADRLQEGLEDDSLRRRITDTAGDFVQKNYSSWEEQIAKIYRYMLSVC
jgi:glycosyltransferase involved in cell wall biosynthesis